MTVLREICTVSYKKIKETENQWLKFLSGAEKREHQSLRKERERNNEEQNQWTIKQT